MSTSMVNISVYERYNDSDVLFFQRFAPHVTIIERTSFPLWAIVGVPGGLYNIYFWSSRQMRRGGSASAAVYQAFLGIVDVSFFIVSVFWYLHVAWQLSVLDHPGVCEIFPILNYFIQYLSPTLTLTFTLERYLAICHPFRSQRCLIRASTSGAMRINAVITVFCMCTAAVQSFVYTYNGQICTTREQIGSEEHIAKALYTNWTILTEVSFFFCMPMTCLVLNIFVIRVLRQTTDRKRSVLLPYTQNGSSPNGTNCENRGDEQAIGKGVRASTLTLLCTSFYVLIAHFSVAVALLIHNLLPAGQVFLSDEDIERDPSWKTYFSFFTIRMLIESFAMSQYAAKFPIYLATSHQFRLHFYVFGLRCCRTLDSFGDTDRFCNSADAVDTTGIRISAFRRGACIGIKEFGSKDLFVRTRGVQGHKADPSQHVLGRNRPSPGLSRSVLGENGERVTLQPWHQST